MIWNAIDFVCRETVLHLRRERLIAVATISTVAVLMLVLGSMVMFLMDVRVWTHRLGDNVEVSAYFERDFSREQAEERTKAVAEWPEVRSARLVPKEEGWEWLRQNLVSSAKLKGLDNPLPDAIRVRTKEPRQVAQVARMLSDLEGVKEVIPNPEEADKPDSFVYRLVQMQRVVTWLGIVIAALVSVAGVFIVHNTIRLALHARRREIYIMQLIGAGRGVIAAPFLLEGVIHGMLGAILGCCLLIPAHMYLRSVSERSAPFLLLAPDAALVTFGVGLVAAGAFLGLTGSAFSVRRYLRRKPEWHS